ncbi:hypothetical protein BofuT4_uP098540.1 [Botrytis cinerea T4]|uniref:Uncharacterized protein n=1 Tax=Botryotinia fuckeliana (strain T4) TaxID=999810 RepID=G2YCG6_BOTF4|nr:hypothetical protein BofuT4_uP098540.1 [Botrytis cinerea T4]
MTTRRRRKRWREGGTRIWDRDGDIIQDGEIPMHFSRLSSYPGFLSRIFPPALC